MSNEFVYVIMEDGEFSACFATLDAAQNYCEGLSNEGVDLLIIEIPVDDIYTPVLRSERWKRAPINKE